MLGYVFLGFGILWLLYGPTDRSDRIADIAQYALLWNGLTTTAIIFSYCAATSTFPLYDNAFDKWDAALGFHWMNWFRHIQSHPALNSMFDVAYNSLIPQMGFSIIYFGHCRLPERNRELLWIALVSVVVTSLLAGIFPARGAFEYFGVPQHALHLAELTALRTPGADSFSIPNLQGIVTMPSYHAAIAVALAYVFRGRGWLFILMAALNFLMLISTLSHGGHYLVDIIGGLMVIGITIAVVRHMQRTQRLQRTNGTDAAY